MDNLTKTREELIFQYIKEILRFDVKYIESIIPRFKGNLLPDVGSETRLDNIEGFRVKARIIEMNRNQDGNARWRTPAESVEHTKVIIVPYDTFTQFKRDKNLEELLDEKD